MKPPISARIPWPFLAICLLVALAVMLQAIPPVAAKSDDGTIAYVRYNDETGDEIWLINPDGTWFEDGRPWFIVKEDNVVYNVAVETSLSAKGS